MENLRWNPTVHAVRRIKERCGIDETQAKSFINQIMASAKYITTQGNRLVYLHEKRNLMVVVNPEEGAVITVHPAEDERQAETLAVEQTQAQPKQALSITVDRIANAVKREFKRMQTEVTREVRKLSEQVAIMHAEAAQLNVNKIRCRNPRTQTLIQARIDEILNKSEELAKVIDVKLTEIERAKDEVGAVIGE